MKRITNHILWEIEEDIEKEKAYLHYYIGNDTKPLFRKYTKKEISIYKYKQLSDLIDKENESKYRVNLLNEEINFQINKIIKKDN